MKLSAVAPRSLMKIHHNGFISPLTLGRRHGQAGHRGDKTAQGPAAQISISQEGNFVSSLVQEARNQTEFRPELVADVKAQIANGTFEESIDASLFLDSLLADL